MVAAVPVSIEVVGEGEEEGSDGEERGGGGGEEVRVLLC